MNNGTQPVIEQPPASLSAKVEALEREIATLKEAAAAPVDHVDLTSPTGAFRLRVTLGDHGYVEVLLFIPGKDGTWAQAGQARTLLVAARETGAGHGWYLR